MHAKLGDEDLLTEIQGIESLRKPVLEELVTSALELKVVDWLQVRGNFFLQVK